MRIPPPAPKPAVTPENAEDDAQSGLAPPAPPQEDAKTFSEPDTVGEAVIDEVVSEEAERILAEDRLEPSQTENTEPGVEEGSVAESAPSPIAPPAPHIGSALSQVKSSNGYASDALEDEDHVPEEEEQDGGLHALHEAALQGEPADEQVGAESAFEGLEPVDAPDDEDIEVGDEEETATNEAEAGYAEENVENDERAAFPAPLRMESEEVHSEVALEEASELSAEDEADENDEEAPISFDGEDSNEAYSEHVSEDQGLEEFAVQEETELEAESDVAASDDQVEGAEVSEEADAAESLEEATETALEEIQSAEEVTETADEEYESAEEEAEAAAEDAEAGEVEAEAEEEAETEVEQEAEVQAETEDAAEEVLAESDDEEDAAAPFINVIPAATIDEEEDELPPTAGQLPTFEDVKKAAVRIAGKAFRTPILESAALNERVGGRVLVKPECLQRTGSFKFRGAYNRISQIRSGAEGGVVAFSSGNHAQGVAAAAQLKGIPAVIVMPEDTPEIKVRNTQSYGAEVVFYDRATENRKVLAQHIAEERGAILVPPFDDADVIAGQGTAALELVHDLAARGIKADAMLVCTGGGGLLGGFCLTFSELSPETQVFAVEPEGFDDHSRSFAAGQRIKNEFATGSICDALLAARPGNLTFAINRGRVAGGLTVSDDEVRDAMRFAFETLKLVVEPGGAVALAAVLAGKIDCKDKAVGVILSGGNVDASLFAGTISPES